MSREVLFLCYIAFGNTVLEKSLSDTVQLQKYYFPRKDTLCASLSSPLPILQFIVWPHFIRQWADGIGVGKFLPVYIVVL